jgi:hypothetical protein
MNKSATEIRCPNCGTLIKVEDVLSQQLEEDMKLKLKSKEQELLKAFEQREASLQQLEGRLKRERLELEVVVKEKLWKEREKQLEKVLLSTSHFYGAIKGIAGSALPTVKLLELPECEAE